MISNINNLDNSNKITKNIITENKNIVNTENKNTKT